MVDVSVHPCGSYVFAATASDVKILDASSLAAVAALGDGETEDYVAGGLHPDGLIYVAGTGGGQVHVWDVKTGTKALTLSVPAPLRGVAFSDNGYHLAVASGSGAQVFDMRKQKLVGTAGSGAVGAVAWEGEGKFLAYAEGGGAKVVEAKKWGDVLAEMKGHAKDVKGMDWGEGGVVTVGLDRKVAVFGA